MNARRSLPRTLAGVLPWLGLSIAWTWPTAIHPIAATPGSAHTDLWENLWTMWFVATRLVGGQSPLRVDGLLDTPHGGSLWPSDPVSALTMMPVTLTAGPAVAWSLLVIAHMTLRGWLGFRIGEAFTRTAPARHGAGPFGVAPSGVAPSGAGWVCGAILALSSMALADVHNGASETLGDTWCLAVVWLGLRWETIASGGPNGGPRSGALRRWTLAAGVLLAMSAIAHWYGGVAAFLLWLALGLRRRSDSAGMGDTALMRRSFFSAGALGILLALPVAYAARTITTASDNVVGIKNPAELGRLRRNIGPADPWAFVLPAPFRSPDFTKISRYGEDYWHSPYLGWVGMALALVSALPRRAPAAGSDPGPPAAHIKARWPLAVIGMSVVLACGPVLTSGGAVVILSGRRAVPLPYFLIEKLPPFDSLSLLWKLGWAAEIGVALCAAAGVVRIVSLLPRRAGQAITAAVTLAVLIEAALFAPTRGLPGHVDTTLPAPVLALREEAPGKVMTWPLIGGLPTLYNQVGHGKMIAGTLNFPASKNAWNVTRSVLRGQAATIAVARECDIRYVVLHLDAPMGGDESGLQLANWDGFPVVAQDEKVRVLKLY